jgi:hypothetical protein
VPSLPPNLETTQRSSPGTWSSGGQIQQISEYVPELRWPGSVTVYNQMRRDGKCAGVLRAATMPIRGTGWHVVDSPDVRPEVAEFVRNNLGLTETGNSRRRRRGQGISWDDFLRHALLMLPFGHMFFEPVYEIGPPGPNDKLPPGEYAHLSRLSPILPMTITGFDIAPTGDLNGIYQQAVQPDGRTTQIPLARDLILPVINDREGADWTGTSILREAYKHWFLKDQLERLGAQIIQRNGMGIPFAQWGDNGDREEMLRATTSFRAGELSGVAMRAQDSLKILGVEGTLVDPMPQITYHGDEIPNSVLAMFLTLGHDAGARSLGTTFVDYFAMATNSIIADLEETITEGPCRRLVELNFGPDEAYPEISADDITPQSPLTTEAMAALVTAGIIHPDAALEVFARFKFGMPPMTPDGENAPPPDVPDDTIAVQGGSSSSHSAPTEPHSETISEIESRLAWARRHLGRRRR